MPGCKNLLIVMYDFSRNDLFNASNNVAKQTPGASSYEESSGKSPYQYFQSLPHNELQALMSEGDFS